MEKFTKKELIIFIGLILLGAILRLYELDLYPAGFHGDEAWTGIEARRILEQGFIGFWSPAALGQTALPFYWTAIIFKLFGESIFSTRLSFALLNIFSIPFFYLIARTIFSAKVAIISTFLLTTGAVPLALARRADYVAANFCFFPALFFFLLSLKTNRTIYFILAGIFLGLSLHMYFAFWFSPILFALFSLVYLLILKRKFFRKYFKGFLLLIIFYIVVASPMLSFVYSKRNIFLSRPISISIFSQEGINHARSYLPRNPNILGILTHNVKATLLIFNLKGDSDIWSTFSHQPLFDPVTGIFFVAGLIFGIRYFKRQPMVLFIYLSFLFFLSGSLFTTDSPNFRRSQVSIQLACIFAGLGIAETYQFLSRKIIFLKRVFPLVTIIFLTTFGLHNILSYFTKHAISSETKYVLAYRLTQAASFIKGLPQPTYAYFYSACCSYRHETLKFLLKDNPGEDRSKEFGKHSLARDILDKNLVYIFYPEYSNDLSEVEKLYPGGQKLEHKDEDGTVLFYSYFLTRND